MKQENIQRRSAAAAVALYLHLGQRGFPPDQRELGAASLLDAMRCTRGPRARTCRGSWRCPPQNHVQRPIRQDSLEAQHRLCMCPPPLLIKSQIRAAFPKIFCSCLWQKKTTVSCILAKAGCRKGRSGRVGERGEKTKWETKVITEERCGFTAAAWNQLPSMVATTQLQPCAHTRGVHPSSTAHVTQGANTLPPPAEDKYETGKADSGGRENNRKSATVA